MRNSRNHECLLFSKTLFLAVIGTTCLMASHSTAFTPLHTPTGNSLALSSQTNIHRRPIQQVKTPLRTSIICSMSEDSETAEQEEWKAVLTSFKMYKAAYGDLKVPLRFVVPAMPPWPKAAWDMKLGQKVSQIRSTGRFIQTNAQRRKILEKLGFIWRARAEPQDSATSSGITADQLYDALLLYREETKQTGPFVVPADFVVPNSEPWPITTRGLPLGSKLAEATSPSFKKEYPGALEKLAAIGLQTNKKEAANDSRFRKVYAALKVYRKMYGDLLIPQPFVVPADSADWPEDTWGLRLGARVNAIRSQGTFVKTNPERKQMLDDLDFIWSPPQARRGRKSIAEQTAQPSGAARTSDDDDQEDIPGLDRLFGTGFDFENDDPNADGTLNAPTWGFDGTVDIEDIAPQEAPAPDDDYTPPKNLNQTLTEAIKRAEDCGIIVQKDNGESIQLMKGKRKPQIPWFNDDFGADFVFEDVVEALTEYKSIYGDFSNLTTEEFVIPAQSVDAEMEEYSPLDFGGDASARAAAAISRLQASESSMVEDIIEADILKLQSEGPLDEFGTEVTWPEHLGGMPLGNIVSRIRDGSLEVKHIPERKAMLDDIDFDWGDERYFIDVPFEKAMCSMYAYYLIRGDMFVPEEFVMLDEEPWPRALAGYELGATVKRIRQLQNFLEAYHVEKVGLLRMIDFVWFPNSALPIDPNEPEMTPELLILSANGHPAYSKLRDIPMGQIDKIMADEPFVETDNPRHWWRKYYSWEYVKDLWYDLGVRDYGLSLRNMGYAQMAAEHEELYGIGLFEQIEETLKLIEDKSGKVTTEEKDEIVAKLKHFRSELIGCNDIARDDLEKVVETLDTELLKFITGSAGGSVQDQLEAALAMEYEGDMELTEIETVENKKPSSAKSKSKAVEVEVEVDEDGYEYEYEYVDEGDWDEEEIDLGLDK